MPQPKYPFTASKCSRKSLVLKHGTNLQLQLQRKEPHMFLSPHFQQIDDVEFGTEPEVEIEPIDEDYDMLGNPVGEILHSLLERAH